MSQDNDPSFTMAEGSTASATPLVIRDKTSPAEPPTPSLTFSPSATLLTQKADQPAPPSLCPDTAAYFGGIEKFLRSELGQQGRRNGEIPKEAFDLISSDLTVKRNAWIKYRVDRLVVAGHDILPEVPLDVLPLPELGDSILPTEKAASTRECKGSTEEGASGVEKAEQQLGPNMANLEQMIPRCSTAESSASEESMIDDGWRLSAAYDDAGSHDWWEKLKQSLEEAKSKDAEGEGSIG